MQRSGLYTGGHSDPSVVNRSCFTCHKYLQNETKKCLAFKDYLGRPLFKGNWIDTLQRFANLLYDSK